MGLGRAPSLHLAVLTDVAVAQMEVVTLPICCHISQSALISAGSPGLAEVVLRELMRTSNVGVFSRGKEVRNRW